MKSLTSFVLVAALCAVTSSAQVTGGDLGGNVTLTINGSSPDINGQVDVVPTTFATLQFSDTTMTTRPLIVAVGNNVVAGGFTVPWGTIDLTAPSILIDGIGFTASSFDSLGTTNLGFAFLVPASFTGLAGPGFQGIYFEPTAPPFFFDNTWAAEGNYPNAMVTVIPSSSYGDDDDVQFALNVPGITLYGITYTEVFLGSNGQITFTDGSFGFGSNTTDFFDGWMNSSNFGGALPGAAGLWADFNNNGLGDITVIENLSSGDVEVQYNNQEYWDSLLMAGSWSVTFASSITPGSVVINLAGALPGQAGFDQEPVSGVTDGTLGVNPQNVINFDATAIGYASMAPSDSIAAQFLMTGNDPLHPYPAFPLTFLDLSNDGTFTIL